MKKNILLLFILCSITLSSQIQNKIRFKELNLLELKNTSVGKTEKCDSIITTDGNLHPVNRRIFDYNNNGKMTLQEQYLWNSTSNLWKKYTKIEEEYSKGGYLIFYAHYSADNNTNTWKGTNKSDFLIDEGRKVLLEQVAFVWSISDNTWIESNKFVYQYNDINKMTSKKRYVCDNDKSKWQLITKTEFQYDDKGAIILEESYQLMNEESDSWKKEEMIKQRYSTEGILIAQENYEWNISANSLQLSWKKDYNNDGYIILYLSYNWNEQMNSLEEKSKSEYKYDQKGNITSQVKSVWRANDNNWVEILKDEYQYNSSDKVTLHNQSSWENNTLKIDKTEYSYNDMDSVTLVEKHYSYDANLWIKTEKLETQYNETGSKILERIYQGIEGNTWKEMSKTEFQYNINNSLLLKIEYGIDFLTRELKEKLKYEYIYNDGGNILYERNYYYNNDWTLSQVATYYYSLKDINSVNENQEENLSVKLYPNPVTDGFYAQGLIDKAQLVLTDLNGRILLNQPVENNNFINISPLPQGIYLVKIRGAQDNLDQKIIKK